MFGCFFRRKPSSPPSSPPSGDSPEDWRAGDIAECVNRSGWFLDGKYPASGPCVGERARVVRVRLENHPLFGRTVQALVFSRFGERPYDAAGFRKVRPQADARVAAEPRWLDKLIGSRRPACVLEDA